MCGIPQRIVRLLAARGWGWLLGKEQNNRHLTCDHIDPAGGSERENLRSLCYACNCKRQDDMLTDEELLVWARGQWAWRFGDRIARIYWLNTHFENGVAVGGRPFRSKNHEKIERRTRGES